MMSGLVVLNAYQTDRPDRDKSWGIQKDRTSYHHAPESQFSTFRGQYHDNWKLHVALLGTPRAGITYSHVEISKYSVVQRSQLAILF
jgi:hypothetical protein